MAKGEWVTTLLVSFGMDCSSIHAIPISFVRSAFGGSFTSSLFQLRVPGWTGAFWGLFFWHCSSKGLPASLKASLLANIRLIKSINKRHLVSSRGFLHHYHLRRKSDPWCRPCLWFLEAQVNNNFIAWYHLSSNFGWYRTIGMECLQIRDLDLWCVCQIWFSRTKMLLCWIESHPGWSVF